MPFKQAIWGYAKTFFKLVFMEHWHQCFIRPLGRNPCDTKRGTKFEGSFTCFCTGVVGKTATFRVPPVEMFCCFWRQNELVACCECFRVSSCFERGVRYWSKVTRGCIVIVGIRVFWRLSFMLISETIGYCLWYANAFVPYRVHRAGGSMAYARLRISTELVLTVTIVNHPFVAKDCEDFAPSSRDPSPYDCPRVTVAAVCNRPD